jgi:hypothetical protein
MKNFILGLIVVTIAILSTGCGDSGGDNPPTPSVISIEANASSGTIPLGLSVVFTTTANLSDSSFQDVTSQATYDYKVAFSLDLQKIQNGTKLVEVMPIYQQLMLSELCHNLCNMIEA